jgi:hypothetical protein
MLAKKNHSTMLVHLPDKTEFMRWSRQDHPQLRQAAQDIVARLVQAISLNCQLGPSSKFCDDHFIETLMRDPRIRDLEVSRLFRRSYFVFDGELRSVHQEKQVFYDEKGPELFLELHASCNEIFGTQKAPSANFLDSEMSKFSAHPSFEGTQFKVDVYSYNLDSLKVLVGALKERGYRLNLSSPSLKSEPGSAPKVVQNLFVIPKPNSGSSIIKEVETPFFYAAREQGINRIRGALEQAAKEKSLFTSVTLSVGDFKLEDQEFFIKDLRGRGFSVQLTPFYVIPTDPDGFLQRDLIIETQE